MNKNDNITQIMLAPENLYSLYHNDEGDEVGFSIVCMALTKDDDIKFCDVDDSGYINIAKSNDIKKYNTEIYHFTKLNKRSHR